jgi:hypothetical protein
MKAIRLVLGWGIAVVVTVLIGSLVQTQFNLAAISGLGVEIGLADRISTTWHDLQSFTPLYAVVVALAFAVAWPLAGWLKHWLPGHRTLLFTLAGFSAVWVTIAVMNRTLPITAIGATRELVGTLALAAAGAFAGWVYSRIVGPQ